MPIHPAVENLMQFARAIGASNAAAVSAASIVVKDELSGLCTPAACPNYGRSAGCPPHVPGPDAFRALLETFSSAVVLKIEVPIEALRSGRCEFFFVNSTRSRPGLKNGPSPWAVTGPGPLPEVPASNSFAPRKTTARS